MEQEVTALKSENATLSSDEAKEKREHEIKVLEMKQAHEKEKLAHQKELQVQ